MIARFAGEHASGNLDIYVKKQELPALLEQNLLVGKIESCMPYIKLSLHSGVSRKFSIKEVFYQKYFPWAQPTFKELAHYSIAVSRQMFLSHYEKNEPELLVERGLGTQTLGDRIHIHIR